MEIIGIFGYGVSFGDISVVFVFRRSYYFYFAIKFSLFYRFFCPNTCLQISSFFVQQVGRNGEKLSACTTTEEEHLIVVRNVEKFSPQVGSLFHHAFPTRSTVRDFEQSDTGAVKITNSLNSRFYRRLGEDTRSSIKIMKYLHFV